MSRQDTGPRRLGSARRSLAALAIGVAVAVHGCVTAEVQPPLPAPVPRPVVASLGVPTPQVAARARPAGPPVNLVTASPPAREGPPERLPPPRQGAEQQTNGHAAGPAVPPPAGEYPIDLEVAWALAGVQSPTIGLAREAISEALARQMEARSLLLPNLTAGMNYHLHRGNLQASPGIIRSVNEDSLYIGGGARSLAAESVGIPMVRVFTHLGDALFEPLAARQRVANRTFAARATENQVLLEVTLAYFELLGAETRLEALRASLREFAEVARLTRNFARTGQGRQGDAERARAREELLRGDEERAEEEVAVASARLAQLLSLAPSVRLRSPDGALPLIDLAAAEVPLEALVAVALNNWPEIAAATAAVLEADARVRQEATRPLLPLLSVGYSAAGFGGGSDLVAAGIAQPGGGVLVGPRFGRFSTRQDFDVFLVWTLQNVGFGNVALYRRRRAEERAAVAEQSLAIDQARREVEEARADALAAKQQIEPAREEVRLSEAAYKEDLRRAYALEGRPIELIDSARQLAEARQALIGAITRYNQAQFALFVALGQPPSAALAAGREGRYGR